MHRLYRLVPPRAAKYLFQRRYGLGSQSYIPPDIVVYRSYCCRKLPESVDDEGQFSLFYWSRCQRLTRQLVEQ